MKYRQLSINNYMKSVILSMKESWRITLLTSLFICGLIISAFVIKNSDSILSVQINEIIKASITRRSSAGFLMLFLDSFAPILFYFVMCFTFGLCAVGVPLISFLPVIKGFGVGLISSYIYSTFSVRGVCYCLLIYFPAQIISSALLVYACNEGYYMAADIFSLLRENADISEKNAFKLYVTRFLLLTGFGVLTALLDCLLSLGFTRFFRLF
jgi:hypothetical protein